jgi:AcrR family transcriptional regulator
MTSTPPAGLRERKKARTRAAIRENAMRLFEEQGYAVTTVEQIADAAEVSPSTFFRYFPSKEDVALSDEFDPLILAAMRAQPAELDPIETIRRSVKAALAEVPEAAWHREQQRQRLIQAVPELRARVLQEYANTIDALARVLAERAGRPPDDFSARVAAGAIVGAMMAALPNGFSGTLDRGELTFMDRALDQVRDGLALPPA